MHFPEIQTTEIAWTMTACRIDIYYYNAAETFQLERSRKEEQNQTKTQMANTHPLRHGEAACRGRICDKRHNVIGNWLDSAHIYRCIQVIRWETQNTLSRMQARYELRAFHQRAFRVQRFKMLSDTVTTVSGWLIRSRYVYRELKVRAIGAQTYSTSW